MLSFFLCAYHFLKYAYQSQRHIRWIILVLRKYTIWDLPLIHIRLTISCIWIYSFTKIKLLWTMRLIIDVGKWKELCDRWTCYAMSVIDFFEVRQFIIICIKNSLVDVVHVCKPYFLFWSINVFVIKINSTWGFVFGNNIRSLSL